MARRCRVEGAQRLEEGLGLTPKMQCWWSGGAPAPTQLFGRAVGWAWGGVNASLGRIRAEECVWEGERNLALPLEAGAAVRWAEPFPHLSNPPPK